MDINQIALSQYKTVASINEEHNIFLVQNIQTNQFFVKKILDVYNLDIYKLLMRHPVSGTPQIMVCTQVNGQLIIIEEYLSGTSLDKIIHARNYTFYDIIHYMIELCNILEQFHNLETPIIHRDIKLFCQLDHGQDIGHGFSPLPLGNSLVGIIQFFRKPHLG